MSAGQHTAIAFTAMFDTERLLYGPSGSLVLLSGPQHATTEATYIDGWKFPRKEYDDLGESKKYRKLYVADLDGTRKAKLKAMTAIQVGNRIYKSVSKDPHLSHDGGVPSYEIKVYSTGGAV